MSKNSYYVTRSNKKRETMFLEYEKMDGYCVNPKVKEKGAIEVSKIVFVNHDMSEKIIRKKIDKKIQKLLDILKMIDEDDDSSVGVINRSLLEAEELRMQILNKYVKYLGNTYESLTMKKIQIIVESLRFKLYTIMTRKEENLYNEQKESKRGR